MSALLAALPTIPIAILSITIVAEAAETMSAATMAQEKIGVEVLGMGF